MNINKVKNFFKLKTLFSRLLVSFVGISLVTLLAVFTIVMPQQNVGVQVALGIFTSLLSIGLCVLATFINCKLITKPVRTMIDMTNKISSGEYGTRYKSTKNLDNDLVELVNHFNRMANEFENLEQMRKSFVANASHEMRSPLTSIQGFIQGVLDGTVPEADTKKYLNVVLSETKRLSTMINSMLDLSRIESGKIPVNKENFDINEAIRRILIKFEPATEKNNMSLCLDFVNEKNYVFADRARIEQVVVNLVDNAIKYSPSGTKVTVTTHIHGNKLYVSVKDEGVGISKKDQMLIWDRFYMADKARTPGKSKGTGLGLAIVKKIIEEHGEVIWVESNKGEGAAFIFTLELYNQAIHKKVQNISAQPVRA